MKKLEVLDMESTLGGLDKLTTGVCGSSGFLLAGGAVLIVAGVVTGGVAYAVVGGLGAYFGTTTGLLCAML